MHEFPQGVENKPLPVPLGDAACLKIDGMFVIVSSRRGQCFTPRIWGDFGVDITSLKLIVVKSTNHFYAAHQPIAGEVIFMTADGALPGDVRTLDYRQMSTADKYPWAVSPLG